MTREDTERLAESNPTATTNGDAVIYEIPAKPFRITMELPLLLTMMSITFSGAAVTNLILYRTCYLSLGYPKTECAGFLSVDSTNETNRFEEEVQKYATFVSTARGVMAAMFPAILTCFLGVWSDTYGRKPLVVWPLLGLALSGILTVVYSMMDNLGPWWFLLTAIPYSLSGGIIVMVTGAYCYLNDITSTENRSLRILILGAAVSFGGVIGSIASPYVLRAVGHVYLLLITAVLNVIAYVFTNVWIRESLREALEGTICSVLDLLLFKEMIRECFKRRSNKGRTQILLITLANSMAVLIAYGITGLEYFYTRQKLQWTLQDFTSFSAVNTTIGLFGAFFGISVIQKVFRISDLAMINVAFVCSVIEYTSKALATETWHLYLGSVLSLFRELSSTLLLSLITKILPLADVAKLIALMSAIEGIWPLISPVVYSSLYAVTLGTFPASIYVLSIALTIASIVSTGFVQYYRWNLLPYERLDS